MKMGFNKKCEEFGVSPVIGVILIVAITVIIAASLGVAVFGFGDMLEESSSGETSVEVSESSNGITVQPISSNYDEDIEVLANGNVVETIPAGSMNSVTVDYSDDNISSGETKIIVRSGDTILHETTVNPSDDQYYNDPPDSLSSSDFELVTRGFNEDKFSNLDMSNLGDVRHRDLSETWEVKIKNDTWDPNAFNYSWDTSNNYGWVVNIQEDGKQADYSYVDTYYNSKTYVKVTVSDGDNSVQLSRSFTVTELINSVTIESQGGYDTVDNEDMTYNSSDDRIVDTEEYFEVTSVSLHSSVDDKIDYDFDDFAYNWYDGSAYDWMTNVKTQNGETSTFEYVDAYDSTNVNANHVSVEIGWGDLSQSRNYGYNSFNVVYR